MIKVKYNCIAVPPDGIKLNTIYEIGKDENGSFYTDGKVKTYEDEKIINMLFAPIETTKKTK